MRKMAGRGCRTARAGPMTLPGTKMPITVEVLPKKYSDRDKSELTLEVTRGANEKNWELGK